MKLGYQIAWKISSYLCNYPCIMDDFLVAIVIAVAVVTSEDAEQNKK